MLYFSECFYHYTSLSGVITSSSYPNLKAAERSCTYRIETDANTQISLTIDDFNLSDADDEDCTETYLQITNPLDASMDNVAKCNNMSFSSQIVTQSNYLNIYFHTSFRAKGRGFRLVYSALPRPVGNCGGVFTNPNQTIRLPTGDDGVYAHDMECYWLILAPADKGIMLSWKSFNLEVSTDCLYDYVEIYDSLPRTTDANTLGRLVC